jgi:short-subunit dehydrogenase
MSKAMQDHWARALRIELAGSGVHVSSVHPIGTTTEFFDVSAARSSTKGGLFERTPKAFMQSPERVARAVVACLKRPRGEVWTSLPTRLALAASVAAPGVTDWLLRKKFSLSKQ